MRQQRPVRRGAPKRQPKGRGKDRRRPKVTLRALSEYLVDDFRGGWWEVEDDDPSEETEAIEVMQINVAALDTCSDVGDDNDGYFGDLQVRRFMVEEGVNIEDAIKEYDRLETEE